MTRKGSDVAHAPTSEAESHGARVCVSVCERVSEFHARPRTQLRIAVWLTASRLLFFFFNFSFCVIFIVLYVARLLYILVRVRAVARFVRLVNSWQFVFVESLLLLFCFGVVVIWLFDRLTLRFFSPFGVCCFSAAALGRGGACRSEISVSRS